MQIIKCGEQDITLLAAMNKRLIEDEKSNNPMNISELENRMKSFLETEYDAYFFRDGDDIAGYALVKRNCSPPYLRQFFIERDFRQKHLGTTAFRTLLDYLKTDSLDIEVLTRNETGIKFWEKLGFEEISRYMRYKK
ncbi:MAG: GNAT family N-acetyltransferase [Oscillospiraceae bacterium]|nr:GNAT family N-acetyltransferase [Oscillospiraceae bacterium]